MNKYNGKKRNVEERVAHAMERVAVGVGLGLLCALYYVVCNMPNGIAG